MLASLETQYDASKNAIPDSPFKNKGIAAGTAAAQAMIDARQGDGRFGPSQWMPNSESGTLDRCSPAEANDPTPWVGGVKPFLMRSSSQFRSAGPPALTSAAWAADFNEVKAKGQGDRLNPDGRADVHRQVVAEQPRRELERRRPPAHRQNNLDVSDSARLLAMENLVAADAAINTWNDKYHFDFWRPWKAIVRAAEDENDATVADDLKWTPLLTAPYPEHTSGHLGLDSSHTSVLRMFFGNAPAGGYQITSSFVSPGVPGCPPTTCPATRPFTSFSQAVNEIVEARIWAGLHFRTADVQAVQLGTNIANFGAANYFQPVGNH